jgi:2-dehydropantoate 2-reductase
MTELLVVGAGAIGGVTAARLTLAGAAVTVLDADERHVARIRNPGLLIETPEQVATVRMEAYTSAEQLPRRYDAALLAVKATALEPVVTSLLRRTCIDALVSLGNGLIHDELNVLARGLPVVPGIVEWGATYLGPGHLRQTTRGPFVLGGTDPATRERSETLAETLRAAWEVTTTDHIEAHIWAKLLLNSTFSGLGTVLGDTYEAVLADPKGRTLALATWREGLRTTRHLGLALPSVAGIDPDDLGIDAGAERVETGLAALNRQVGATRASMLQDLERGRPTEVHWINGGVRRTAERLGLPVACNEAIEQLILEMEAGTVEPGITALHRLHAAVGLAD